VVTGLTLVSRFAGLARELTTVYIFGAGAVGSAFAAAFAIPNLFRRLFGEGALSAAFLPEYSSLRKADPARAEALASLTLRWLLLITGSITLLIELALVATLLLGGASDPDRRLSLLLIIVMLPMMPMVCVTAILGGMLQVHGKFGPPAAAPIILNLFMIAAGAFYFFAPGSDDAAQEASRILAAYLIGAAAVAASLAQVAWSMLALRGHSAFPRDTAIARDSARAMFSRFIPVVIGMGTLQLNTLLDTVIAMWPIWVGPTILGQAYPLDESSNVILTNVARLYQFPLGVFGIAVATAVFPLLSLTADDPGKFTDTLRRGVRLSLFIGLPASAGLVVVAPDMIGSLFGLGSKGYQEADIARAASVLIAFAPGVWAYALNHVLTRAFYARQDTRTPMRVALAMVALNLTLNWTLIWFAREAGLAWATSSAAIVQCGVLILILRRRWGIAAIDREALAAIARLTLITLLMAAAVLGALALASAILSSLAPDLSAWSRHAIRMAVGAGVGVASYAGLSLALRVPELRWLTQRAPKGPGGATMSGMDLG
jgi:putative peptidoglycan lipid II flippase